MSIKRTYSFPDEDSDVVKHIDLQDNSSAYIRNLVKRDMENGGLPEGVKKYIDKRLQELMASNCDIAEQGKPNLDKESIMEVFNLSE